MSNNSSRIGSLDSIRGLASLTVVIHHTLLVLPLFLLANNHEKVESLTVNILSYTPLHMIWGGYEAVMLFFILSGFVLSLPFLNNRNTSYSKYIIKRFCRIYIPYIISMGISIILFALIDPSNKANLSEFVYYQWHHPVSVISIISYLFMLDYDSFNINGATWSLVHEMRISLVFPFLMIFIMKFNWKKSLSIGISLCLLLWCLLFVCSNFVHIDTISFLLKSFGETFYYTTLFIIGATLAKYRETLVNKIKKISLGLKTLAFTFIILLYSFEWVSFGFGDLKFNENAVIASITQLTIDFAIAASVILLFILVLSSNRIQSMLNKKSLTFLGKISYSLYLIHSLVLLTMIHLLSPHLPLVLILILIPLVSLLIAIPYHYVIEKPSIKLGKHLTSSKYSNKSTVLHKKRLAEES